MCPEFDPRTRRHMWVEFVVGSLLCSERFFSGYSGFPLSSKTNISKFQFDLDVRHFSPEPLAWVIAQALPVLTLNLPFFTLVFLNAPDEDVRRNVDVEFDRSLRCRAGGIDGTRCSIQCSLICR